MSTLVLLRHGESEWNLANRFTGWVDVDLSERGVAEAIAAGRMLRDAGLRPDIVPTLAGPDGGYADYHTNFDGTVVRIRAGDGIHFERAGADRVAAAVLAVMSQAFDLTSGAATTTTTTTAPPKKQTGKPKR